MVGGGRRPQYSDQRPATGDERAGRAGSEVKEVGGGRRQKAAGQRPATGEGRAGSEVEEVGRRK